MKQEQVSQIEYWDKRARGDLDGLKNKLLSRLFRTGYVGINRLIEYRMISRHLQGPRIIDIGCGDGKFMARLKKAHPNRSFYGIDFCPSMIEIANKRQLDATVMDMGNIEADDQSYDTAYAVRAIKNILDRDGQAQSIRQMCRITANRVILFDTFENQSNGKKPVFYNYPLNIDHVQDVVESCGFWLVSRSFFPSRIRFWQTVEEQVSPEGCMVFDRLVDTVAGLPRSG